MARKPTGNPPGPPEKPIDWKLFEQLCGILCTQSEMASLLNVHKDTLSDRARQKYGESYSDVYRRFSEAGHCSLRRHQFVLSKRNSTMAIWLGKIWLKQKEDTLEIKELVIHELREGIRLVSEERRGEITQQSTVAPEPPVLDR